VIPQVFKYRWTYATNPNGSQCCDYFTTEDIETLQLIRERHHRDDHSGIIAHILSQYEMKVESGLNTKVQA
jgi:hypothetical protein